MRATRLLTQWNFVPRAVAAGLENTVPNDAELVTAPHTWNAVDGTDGGNDYRRGAGSYVHVFSHHQVLGTRTWLEVGAANSSAEVWLNGLLLGRHDGGYSTFRVDLSDALTEQNTLLIVVDNAPSASVYPQRADFTFYGGLYREVALVTVPEHHISLGDHGGPGLVVTPQLDGRTARVTLTAQVTGGESVRFSVAGVGQLSAAVVDGVATGVLEISEVRRWHGLRDPHLYVATAELVEGGTAIDDVSLRFGCRTMTVDPDLGFLLNGEPYPLRGVSRHQDFAGVGNATSDEHLETDMALLAELGATTVRLAHYQHSQRTYDACDAAGIVVWAEPPVITEYLPGADQNAVDQLTELVVQNRHHASIACWALSNEITVAGIGDQLRELHARLDDRAHELDPTRLTAMAHFFGLDPDDPLVTLPDVMSYNLYYGWYVGELGDNDAWLDDFHSAHPGVAIGVSEYGADANSAFQTSTPVRGDYSEQYQARYHEHLIELIEARPWLWATHVWNLADFGADGRTEGGVAGLNQKGLVTFDRTLRKDAFYAYKAAWSDVPFVHLCGRRYVDRPEATTEVIVYSNQPEVALLRDGVEVGRTSGRRVFRFDVPLAAEHELTARAGDHSDTILVRRVAEPNPDYAMTVAGISNWFDLDLPAPTGHYSVKDTLADVKASAQGADLLAAVMEQATANRGDVAQKVEMPASFQRMLDRMTVEALLRQAGPTLAADHVIALNRALNRIPKIRVH